MEALKAYMNLPRPNDVQPKVMEPTGNTGLLSRGAKAQPKKSKMPEPRQRVANYVGQLYRARMELRNG